MNTPKKDMDVKTFSEVLRTTDGWQALDIVSWLLVEGRLHATLEELTERLCAKLMAASAPVTRVRLIVRILNPLVIGQMCDWTPNKPVTSTHIAHDSLLGSDFIGSPVEHMVTTGNTFRRRLVNLDNASDHTVLHELASAGFTDYLGVPLLSAKSTTSGTIFIVNTDASSGFTDTDIDKLLAISKCIAPILSAIAANLTAQSLLGTYLGPRTGERVLNGQVRRGDGESIRAALWYSDLRESTTLTERLPLEEFLETLNEYFALVAQATTSRGGEILRFIGDAMLIVFNEEVQRSARDACEAAIDAADDARNALATLNHRRRRRHQPELNFGVGLHYGDVVYGNVGAPERLDFTVMGAAVNRTARLESLTKALDEPVVLSSELAEHLERPTRSLGFHDLRGVAAPQEVFTPI